MEQSTTRKLLCFYILVSTVISCISSASARTNPTATTPNLGIKAVNLGGWLVTEGWIKPSLFDAIPNKDFLDGTALQFQSVTVGKYLCAELGGGSIIVANRTSASAWETFRLWRMDATNFQLRVSDQKFVGLNGNVAVATADASAPPEAFQIVRNSGDPNRVRIKAPNGLYLQVKTEEVVTADAQGDGTWGDNDPTVFVGTVSRRLYGEYQVTNGYGPTKAPQVMQEHWSTFIVEADFKFISENGVNAVRIPVGWWIASDPSPPKPYVGGSLQALDNAFTWAEKYRLKVIIDLHAAEGSQNGNDHSSSRDGSLEWGLTDQTVQNTVSVIDFLTTRYANSPSLYAVELLNEPLAPGVTLDTLTNYYKAGYAAVRKHSSSAYVIMSNRLGVPDARELFPVTDGLERSVIDVHYYNLYSSIFDSMTVQQNIDYVNTNRTEEVNYVNTANGPLVLVGEWVAEWQVQGASKEDYQRFAKAQLDLFGRASFGWAYWTLKNVNNHWSMQWMITNGYITL